MDTGLPSHFIDLVYDALLKSFWRKESLRRFLRRAHISDTFLAQLSADESKREWLDRLFPKLEASGRGQAVIQQMARSLADQAAFPDLENMENADEKIRAAKKAVAALREYLKRKQEEEQDEKEAARKRQAA